MDWALLVKYAQDFLVLAALVGGVWSAFEFVRGARQRQEVERAELAAKWRRVSAHKILHSSPNFLSVDEILEKLKSSSFDEDFKINKSELTERELRAVLLEGIEKGYFEQLHSDKYGISSRDFVMDNAFALLQTREQLHRIYDLLCFAKGPLSTQEILKRLGENGMDLSDFEITMYELTSRDLVERRSEDGLWQRKGT